MRPARWSFVPTVLGLILLAAWAADSHELLTSAQDDDWRLLARAETEFFGGLWLLSGLFPRWARRMALTGFLGIFLYDVARAVTRYAPRYLWGRVATGAWWVLGSDAIIVFALLRSWRVASAAAGIDSHPWQVIGMALVAIVLGVTIGWLQVGCYPIIATAWSDGLSGSPILEHVVYLPDGYYRSFGRWPLILYLHGAGVVGREIARARAGGIPLYLEQGGRLPFIVVAPKSPQHGWDAEALDALLDEVLRQYRVDADRVYLTGGSMGGYGTWALAAAHPERFAAIAPICGGGDTASAARLRSVPTWAFHGAEDDVVSPEKSREMVAALERAGGDVRLTIYPGVGHDSATMTYNDRKLYDWFLDHRRRRVGEGKVE